MGTAAHRSYQAKWMGGGGEKQMNFSIKKYKVIPHGETNHNYMYELLGSELAVATQEETLESL